MLTKLLIKYLFRQENEFIVFLGSEMQPGSLFAILDTRRLWAKESFAKRIKSLLKLKWIPSEEIIQDTTKEVFIKSTFGDYLDYGDELFKINAWHNSRKWTFDNNTNEDLKKSESLNAVAVAIRTDHRRGTSKYLNLHIAKHAPQMCILLHPMVVKVPVVSIRYYLEIHSAFVFNEIRKANYSNSNDLISYIYELQFIQQKIALSLHEYLRLIDYNEKKKTDMLLRAELSAITIAENVFMYLKASVEKIIVIIGLIYGIKNIDSKKTHKSKLDALYNAIPARAKNLFYCDFILEFIKSENIDDLNAYRNGILHKKGISDLQPHNYVRQNPQSIPLRKIFKVLIEQHSKNTAVLIGVYAMLTDELVITNPPNIKKEVIPSMLAFPAFQNPC